jgi:hypothetical protein
LPASRAITSSSVAFFVSFFVSAMPGVDTTPSARARSP